MRTTCGRRLTRLTAISAAIVLSVALAACGGSSHKTTTSAAADNWPSFGNTTNDTRYSTLSQINTSNVSKLGIAWAQSEGSNLSTWEDYPVVVDGTMYITTSADEVEALNAATGAVKWTYVPKVNFYLAIAGGGGGVPTNRGVAIANGKVYLETFDDRLIALQQSTGEQLFQTQIANPADGYSETSAPTVYGNTVYVGSAESDAGLRGFVAAYNATTGAQLWRFYAVPAPGHGWMPATGEHGGGDVWMPITVDPSNNTVYFGTGNPSPDFVNSQREGCDPYVDSTVALNATTGALRWAHNEVCPDLWDYDTEQNPIIFDTTVDGKTVPAVGDTNKDGLYTVMNAQTGAVISKVELVPYTEPHPAPDAAGVKVCPGDVGGTDYSPASFDPQTGAVYQDIGNVCMTYTAEPTSLINVHQSGQVDLGGTATPVGPVTGAVASIDPATGKVNWKTSFSKFAFGGTMSTAGGLVFSGVDTGDFDALNAKTGKILYSADLGLPYGAAPMSYQVGNTQYVAIVAGGANVAAIEGVPAGGELVVFKLNGSPAHKFPTASSAPGALAKALPNLATYKKIAPFVYADAAAKKAVVQVIAADTSNNAGFNFDGYAKGQANFVVPVGWTISLEFSNKSATPHDMALTANLNPHVAPIAPTGAESPIAIPGPTTITHGLTATDGTIVAGFSSNAAGKYYLVCGVPGHIAAGMWDYLTVSATAKQPSVQVK